MILGYRAEQLAKAAVHGKPILVLCYNKPLADWMNQWADQNLDKNLRPNVWIGDFHSMCVQTRRATP